MTTQRNSAGFAQRALFVAISAALAAASGSAYAVGQTDVGRSVQNLGGNTLQVRAADAIFVTCAGLDGVDDKTPDQLALNLRCADMSQQAIFLNPISGPTPAIPGADVFGLARLGATGVQQYFSLLQQFSGEEASTQGRYATEGSASQFKSLASRLGAIRRGARNSGLAFNLQGVDVLSVADASDQDSHNRALIGGAASESDADLGWAWFGNVEYGFGDRDSSDNENAYDADSFAALFGVDYAVSENIVVGAALNLSRTDVDFDREAGSGIQGVSGGGLETRNESLSVFASFSYGPMYASTIFSYGRGDVDMERVINIGLPSAGGAAGAQAALLARASSDTETDQWAAETQIGYTFGETATTLDLYGGLSLASVKIDGFREEGTVLGLTFGSQEIDSLEGFFGASVRRAMSTSSGVFVPYASAELRYEFDNDERTLSARYTLTPRAPGEIFQNEIDDFLIPTDGADNTYVDVTLGVSAQYGNNMAAFAQFSSLLALKDVTANVFTIGLRGSF